MEESWPSNRRGTKDLGQSGRGELQTLQAHANPREPRVSVIIPTTRDSKTLERTLESLRRQTYRNIEVLTVDKRKERTQQLNIGISEATGKYLYRVDDDFLLEPTVIEECVALCEQGYDAVCVHNTSDPSVSLWARVRKAERDCYADDWDSSFARFLKREVLDEVGGFNEKLYAAEDRELHERVIAGRFKVGRIRAVETHVGEPRNLAEVVRKHVYYGKGIGAYLKASRSASLWRLGPIRRAYVRHWRELTADPTIILGLVLYQYVRYASALAGFFLVSPVVTEAQLVPVGESLKTVDVVITTRRRPEALRACLASTKKCSGITNTIVVRDEVKRIFLAEARNRGARQGTSDLIFFLDDDNVVDPNAVREMANAFSINPLVAVVSPVIYYANERQRVWFAGGGFNPISGILGVDRSVPPGLRETKTFHNSFMIRRDCFVKLGGFDSKWFPMYLGEADWAERAAEAGYKFVVTPRASVWHDIEPVKGVFSLARGTHITEPARAYFVARNRLIFLRLHMPASALVFHVVAFMPAIILIHLIGMSFSKRYRFSVLLGPYARGILDGLSMSTKYAAKAAGWTPNRGQVWSSTYPGE